MQETFWESASRVASECSLQSSMENDACTLQSSSMIRSNLSMRSTSLGQSTGNESSAMRAKEKW